MISPDFLFPRFLVFLPANPRNVHIANVLLSGFPFFFFFSTEVLFCTFRNPEVERQEAVSLSGSIAKSGHFSLHLWLKRSAQPTKLA